VWRTWRYYAVLFLLIAAATTLVLRMVSLSVLDRNFLLKEGKARSIRTMDIPAYRGMITDRNGLPMAVSAPVDALWVNPKIFSPNKEQINELSHILRLPAEKITQKIDPEGKRSFAYLARGLSPESAEKINTMKIQGLNFQREYRRFYPSADVSAQLLGFTNIDDQGQEGLELAFNDWLKGVPGQRQVIKSRLGQVISNLGVLRDPQEGRDLRLSIDSRLQHLAYDALTEALPKFNAESGSIVILNPKTGEILCMVNAPSYNPNHREKQNSHHRNRAVTDLFEPGSTMKPFSILNGLASGKYKPSTIIDTNPGQMKIGKYTIREAKDKNFGAITVSNVLQKSSNIGTAKITLSLPPKSLWQLLTMMGFGEKTESGFPGERSGVLIEERFKNPTELATMAYGYGLSVTALQLAQGYAILAGQGERHPITFVKTDHPESSRQIVRKELTQQILTMLKGVAEEGGGAKAKIPGYQVGGKTGTAYMLGPNGYDKSRYVSSFVGIAPLSDPQLIGVVVIHGVTGAVHYGSQVSAPIFGKVISGALRYLNIPPDEQLGTETSP
jgi:cell division protein FtsI (penicillin-binding protein 3)